MTTSVLAKLGKQAALGTLAMLALWLILDATLTASVWANMTVSQSALTVEYCEFNRPGRLFHQPSNTYSNLAYVFFGLLVSGIARHDAQYGADQPSNPLAGFPLLSALVGGCLVYLGFGSAFFHASLTYAGQRVDMNGTYGVLLSLVSVMLYHVGQRPALSRRQQRQWVLASLAVIGLFLPLSLRVPSSRLVPALILLLNAGMVIHYVRFPKQRAIGWVGLGFGLIVLAIYVRTRDVHKVGCDPYSWVQGHAGWHLLTALSTFCSYGFFRFTKPARPQVPPASDER